VEIQLVPALIVIAEAIAHAKVATKVISDAARREPLSGAASLNQKHTSYIPVCIAGSL